jgi:hypothetical protein
MNMIQLIPPALYALVGLVSLLMAWKTLTGRKFLPFHAEASGKTWEEFDERMHAFILAMMRLTGLGFLLTGIMMLSFPFAELYHPSVFIRFAVPALAELFCFGLFLINYRLYKQTGANTPWKNSIIAMGIVLAGILISLIF